MTFLNDKLFLNNVKVNIVLSHTFGPRKELHILRLEFYVRQQNQSTQFSDFKAKIVNVNLRILILKTKNQGHRSISQWWSLFSVKLKRKIRMRIIIISSFSKQKSMYFSYNLWYFLYLRFRLSQIFVSKTRYSFIEWCSSCTFASCSTQMKFARFTIKIRCVNDTKRRKNLPFLMCEYWNAIQRISIRFFGNLTLKKQSR